VQEKADRLARVRRQTDVKLNSNILKRLHIVCSNMDDYENEVEMTEPSGRSNRGKKKGPNGTRGNIKNVSTVVVDEDGIVLDHAIRRQNSCCIFMFAVILIAASAFVVSQFYSMPQELDTFATGEGGGGGVDSGIVGNDVVNSEQQEKKITKMDLVVLEEREWVERTK